MHNRSSYQKIKDMKPVVLLLQTYEAAKVWPAIFNHPPVKTKNKGQGKANAN
jgi:hypothetical protein